ncbi:MAG: hypothetical protein A2942_04750 [Candidatus Lloydbacteria bacterium RIFCSPLOWO2_01_FULL_50_20]|uniref:Uncharacterized protein n=1 Tax=Candidatus Lloydbacteria bacterium RIFCSPLOWO2_01_FULL_50_20 TaxID=1798665 RepID=A0A1G2DIZ1_9BACT|nr:MAG: hypothetical protein A2942_04750 [Candidatus Lloydbacteria bacterium RIFCSPLOWO2_01_FULL_50_20]
MKSVRIEPVNAAGKTLFAIDVVCDCGRNGLEKVETGDMSFRHLAGVGASHTAPYTLRCTCGRTYQVASQVNHIHVHQLDHTGR